MSISEAVPQPENKKEPPDPASVTIRVPKGCACDVEGFSTAEVEKVATITLTGKVVEVESSSEKWNAGRRLRLSDVSNITVQGPRKNTTGISIAEALESAGVKV